MCEVKLDRVFSNLLRADFKITDDTMLEKLLTHLGNDTEKEPHLLTLPACEKWVKSVWDRWSEEKISCSVTSFALQLFGFIMKDETRFKSFISDQAEFARRLAEMCSSTDRADFTIKWGYLKMIQSFTQHSSGRQWIVDTNVWQTVLSWCRDRSIFVVREARVVMVMLLNSLETDDSMSSENIVSDILSPLLVTPTCDRNQHSLREQLRRVTDESNFLSALQILNEILIGSLNSLDTESCTVKSSVVSTLHLPKFNFEEKLLKLVQICEEEVALELLSKALILLYIATFSSDIIKKSWPSDIVARFQTLCDNIVNLQEVLVKEGKVRTVMKTCELCIVHWHVVTSGNTGVLSSINRDTFRVQQLCIQVWPLLVCWKASQNATHSLFIIKLSKISCERFSRILNDYGDVVVKVCIPDSLPAICVSGLTSILPSFSKDNAVLIFRILFYILKSYTDSVVPVESTERNLSWACEESSGLGLVGTPKVAPVPSYISAILDCLVKIMNMFESIRESAEASDLLSLALDVLTSSKVPRTVAVKVCALKIARQCIEKYYPPDSASSTKVRSDSVVDQLRPNIIQLTNDPSWEVRDSTLELLLSIATMAKMKCPELEDLIEEHKLCDMVVDFALNDSESYVCASGIKCLSKMILIDRLWKDNLEKKSLPERMIDFVNGDGGDTVRTEATNFILQVYQYRTIKSEVLSDVYLLMSKVIMSDFHWEVKVNAIRFWRIVIEKHLAEQGMSDEIFREKISSEEHRKTTELTRETIQLRLTETLESISKTGCLQVLFEALLDENDIQVLTEAAEVINFLANILREHGLLPCSQTKKPSTNTAPKQTELVEPKPVVADSSFDDKPKSSHEIAAGGVDSSLPENKNQDEVIDAILADKDISLLANVYRGFGADPPMSEIDETLKTKMSDPMKPSEFLEKLQEIDINGYVHGHRKWIEESCNSLESLLDDMLINVQDDVEFNIADCY